MDPKEPNPRKRNSAELGSAGLDSAGLDSAGFDSAGFDSAEPNLAASNPSEPATPGAPSGAARLKRWLRPAMWALTAVFVVLTGLDLARRWEGQSVDLNLPLLLLSCLPVLLGAFLQGLGWWLLLERMARHRAPLIPALALYMDSQLARYTPGKVGLPLVRMEGAPRLGISRRVMGMSVLVEMLSWTATGAVAGFALLSAAGAPSGGVSGLAGNLAAPLLTISLLGALLLVSVDRKRLPRKLREALGLEGTGPLVPLRLPVFQLLYWATWAAHGYLLALALGAAPRAALSTAGFSPLANVLGFAALLAPAGVGVREAVLMAGLGPVVGAPAAIAAAVLSRIVSLVVDLGTCVVMRAARKHSAAVS